MILLNVLALSLKRRLCFIEIYICGKYHYIKQCISQKNVVLQVDKHVKYSHFIGKSSKILSFGNHFAMCIFFYHKRIPF